MEFRLVCGVVRSSGGGPEYSECELVAGRQLCCPKTIASEHSHSNLRSRPFSLDFELLHVPRFAMLLLSEKHSGVLYQRNKVFLLWFVAELSRSLMSEREVGSNG